MNISPILLGLLLALNHQPQIHQAGKDGTAPSAIPVANNTSVQQLSRYHWQLQTVNGKPKLASGTAANDYKLIISKQQLSISGKCNSMNGSVHLGNQGQFRIQGNMASTMMGCPANLEQADSQVASLLSKANRYTVKGNQLKLTGPNVNMQFVGNLTNEAKYNGEAQTRFLQIRRTEQAISWREVAYSEGGLLLNGDKPWLTSPLPRIQGFTPEVGMQYGVRFKVYTDQNGKKIWVKDLVHDIGGLRD